LVIIVVKITFRTKQLWNIKIDKLKNHLFKLSPNACTEFAQVETLPKDDIYDHTIQI